MEDDSRDILLQRLKTIEGGKWKRIADKLRLVWDEPEGEQTFKELLIADRTEPRKGFPFPVLDLLIELHREYCKTHETKTDIWALNNMR